MELDNVITAILLNNPGAVSYRLSQLGVLQEPTNNPYELWGVITNQVGQYDDGGYQFLSGALDVPIDINGYGGADLLDYYIQNGNRSSLDSALARVQVQENPRSNNPILLRSRGVNLVDLMMCLLCVFLLVLTVFIIKKI